jgi:hypothetical protein
MIEHIDSEHGSKSAPEAAPKRTRQAAKKASRAKKAAVKIRVGPFGLMASLVPAAGASSARDRAATTL